MSRGIKPAGKYDARAPTIFQRDIFLLGPHSVFPKPIRIGGSSRNFQFETLGHYRRITTCSQLLNPRDARRKLAGRKLVEAEVVILTEDDEGKEPVGRVEVEPVTVTQNDEEEEEEKFVEENKYEVDTEEE